MSKISATIVADSLSPQGDRLTSVLVTFPRIILSEINTHRMLSKNTSSSRAIPFKKMVEAIKNDPFIPIAWQKEHTGMQGSEYLTPNTKDLDYESLERDWLQARDFAVQVASELNDNGEGFGVTKQLCNRLLEPFMWTTMLITGSKEGWHNFFNLRCPSYFGRWKSWKETCENSGTIFEAPLLERLQNNDGQAEIHMMALAECIYDAVNESTPKQLQAGEWHIPFEDKINIDGVQGVKFTLKDGSTKYVEAKWITEYKVKVSTAMAARTSYTVVGDEKEVDYQKMIELHDRLLSQDPPHSSPLEHCARAMSDEEYECFLKGEREINKNANHWSDVEYFYDYDKIFGWCNNLKGFIPYRYFIDNNLTI